MPWTGPSDPGQAVLLVTHPQPEESAVVRDEGVVLVRRERRPHGVDEQRQPLDRRDALREMLRLYVELMHANEPVAEWPLD